MPSGGLSSRSGFNITLAGLAKPGGRDPVHSVVGGIHSWIHLVDFVQSNGSARICSVDIEFDQIDGPTFSSIIHLRDFVDTITDDSIRDAPNYAEIRADINIFDEDGFYSPDIIAEPIRTRIHVYMTRDERNLYLPNTFFYADGRFSTVLSADGDLEISIQALSLMRHVPPPLQLRFG
ncbi:hypothetical protein GGTG_14330 [Gaeumannomyces tritici R3-111a-1]|uniref:Uncharacterized protein n=1 Tax=Gaeumannomyces tritici (strain R3-111a-1) TaxID=644352 RepID=J3PL81_GAET3|nr:hypothetical protein GGTG_14330 [Gaeumannomyces tritici R3-111a-1]EJT68090.1 hypothetical protein GGTG_14330 [Gaeumannomyces tritici R3-111a-1]